MLYKLLQESLSDDEALPLAQSALQFLTHTNRSMTPRKTHGTNNDNSTSANSSADKSHVSQSSTSIVNNVDNNNNSRFNDMQSSSITISVTPAANNATDSSATTTQIHTSSILTRSPQLPPFHTSMQPHTSPLQSSPVFGSLPGFADVALMSTPVMPTPTPSLTALASTPNFLSRDLKSHDNLHSVMSTLHGRSSPSIFARTPGFSPRLSSLTSPTLSLTSPSLMSNLVKNPLDLQKSNKHSPSLSAYLGPIGKTYNDGTMTALHNTSPNSTSSRFGSNTQTSPTMISSAFLKSPVISHRSGTMSSSNEFKLASMKSESGDDSIDNSQTFSLMNRLKHIHTQQYKQSNEHYINGKRIKSEDSHSISVDQSSEYEAKLKYLSVGNAMMPINTPDLGSSSIGTNKHLQSMSASPELNSTVLAQSDAGLLSALKHQAAVIDAEVENNDANEFIHGLRCHQCKLKRSAENIAFCCNSNNTGKKLMNNNNIRQCRNKYCDICLLKYYSEYPPSMARRKIEGYINISNTWSCPSCRNVCCCNTCKKQRLRIDPNATHADVTKFSPAMLVAYSMVYYPDELHNIENNTNNNANNNNNDTTSTHNGTTKSNDKHHTPKLIPAPTTSITKTDTNTANTTKSHPSATNTTATTTSTDTRTYPFTYTTSSTTSNTTSNTSISSYPYSYGTTTSTVSSTTSSTSTYPYSYINGLRTNSAASSTSTTSSYPYNYYSQSSTLSGVSTSNNTGTAAALQQTVPSAIVTAYAGYSFEPKTQNYLFTASNLITYLYSSVKKSWIVYSASEAALSSATNLNTTTNTAPANNNINAPSNNNNTPAVNNSITPSQS